MAVGARCEHFTKEGFPALVVHPWRFPRWENSGPTRLPSSWQQAPAVSTHIRSSLPGDPLSGFKWQREPEVSTHFGNILPACLLRRRPGPQRDPIPGGRELDEGRASPSVRGVATCSDGRKPVAF